MNLVSLLSIIETELSPDLNELLVQLDTRLKSDPKLRENIPDFFYLILLKKLQQSIKTNAWLSVSLILKCLKNSAAAFKINSNDNERQVCEFLNEFLQKNDTELNQDMSNCILFSFQYIFNLIQGNPYFCEYYFEQWIEICLQYLVHPNMSQDVINVVSMILVYGCNEKKKGKQEFLTKKLNDRVTPQAYISLLAKLAQELDKIDFNFNDVDQDQMLYWSFKSVDFYFEQFYFEKFSTNSEAAVFLQTSDWQIQYDFLRFLSYKINKHLLSDEKTRIDENDRKLSYFSETHLNFLLNFYVGLNASLFRSIEKLDLDQINIQCKCVKLLANCLSDLLTISEHQIDQKIIQSNISLVQKELEFFECTCRLFKEIHVNAELISLFTVNKQIINFKCELVRLIGILVFENTENQRKLVDNELLHIISNNINIDLDNPFIREWSLIALKHILICLDAM